MSRRRRNKCPTHELCEDQNTRQNYGFINMCIDFQVLKYEST